MKPTDIVLFDIKEVRDNLLPLSYTRPVAEMLVGIHTLRQKWEFLTGGHCSWLTEAYLQEKFPCRGSEADSVYLASHVIADAELASRLERMEVGDRLWGASAEGKKFLLAFRGARADFMNIDIMAVPDGVETVGVETVEQVYDIFLKTPAQIELDFRMVTEGREGQALHRSNTVIGNPDDIFIESGAVVEGVILNVSHGPIYIGRDVEVMEGSCLRGPVALGRHCTVNMSTRIYPGTSLGPWCKVGGELNNVVMLGYSNKAHDGFLGNAVVGEWCNLGAGCVASNLKNDYTEIKLWNYPSHRFLRTGLQFCGLIMADHSKAAINTMFNTATVIGVGVNIHGSGFPRNFVASFSEGGASGFTDVPMQKFFDIATRMMSRRGVSLTDADRRMFEYIREMSDNYK